MEPIRVSVIGAGGMAGRHLRRLLDLETFQVLAVAEVDRGRPDALEGLSLAQAAGARTFVDYRDMLDQVPTEAVFIATPHYLHQPMTEDALARGRHVFCEKPPAPTVESCERMLEAQERCGRVVALGFQHVGHANAQWLKSFIADGGLGPIRDVVAILPNHRPESYYGRSPWAGRMKVDGQWCLDGVLTNQMSHFINESLFFASTQPAPHVARLAPGATRCALYRAHETPALEMDDLGLFRCRLEGGVGFFCAATTALEGGGKLTIEILGERGRALYDGRATVWPHGKDPVVYDQPDEENYLYSNFYQAVREGATPLSPLSEGVKTVAVLESAFQAADYRIKTIKWEDCAGLRDLLYRSARYRCLPGELPDPPAWA